jgi:ubiquinone/menaquinone biosynthesis C-methylase UbiE
MALAAWLGVGVRAFHYVMNPQQSGPGVQELSLVRDRFRALLDQDFQFAKQGYFPTSLLFDFPVKDYLGTVPKGMLEWPRVMRRRKNGNHNDLPQGIDADRYPDYYTRNFHWQTDGWFSKRSADLYDAGVEFLFMGTGDVMRRTIIPPLVDKVGNQEDPRILDIACGTGRTLLQLNRALPNARLYGVDLSPFYIQKARRTLAGVPGVGLLIENAEVLPFQNETFDGATSTFLFHELPKAVRRHVVQEAARVLKPGGIFVVLDSAQLSESSGLGTFLTAFPELYHEPYFKSYLGDDLDQILAENGFTITDCGAQLFAKRVVAIKS